MATIKAYSSPAWEEIGLDKVHRTPEDIGNGLVNLKECLALSKLEKI